MNQLAIELLQLKQSTCEMGELVSKQLDGVLEAVLVFDRQHIAEVALTEKQVDALDERIEKKCEQLLALFSPVARDLRFVFATHKIASDLEGISDNAHAIGKYLEETRQAFKAADIEKLEIGDMAAHLRQMMAITMAAYDQESVLLARQLLHMEAELDRINLAANHTIAALAVKAKKQEEALDLIHLLTIVRKMEKIGDYLTAIAERIIYFVEASNSKHRQAS